MQRINIKPLSVNEAFKGRKFKTDKYHTFQKTMLLSLKPMAVPEGNIYLEITFGFSSKGSDIDNCLKQTIDCLSKKLGFNDNRIYKLSALKVIVPKGSEFIEFTISPLV